MLRASRRGASAPASASCPRVLRSAATGTHQTSGPRKTADFSRGESSSQNRSISCSRCVSVAQVTASDERCCEEWGPERSEEHTSELQSQFHLVCRLLLEKKKKTENHPMRSF